MAVPPTTQGIDAKTMSSLAVPAANEVQCGWGANHTLEGAQEAARAMLAKRDEWSQVMA